MVVAHSKPLIIRKVENLLWKYVFRIVDPEQDIVQCFQKAFLREFSELNVYEQTSRHYFRDLFTQSFVAQLIVPVLPGMPYSPRPDRGLERASQAECAHAAVADSGVNPTVLHNWTAPGGSTFLEAETGQDVVGGSTQDDSQCQDTQDQYIDLHGNDDQQDEKLDAPVAAIGWPSSVCLPEDKSVWVFPQSGDEASHEGDSGMGRTVPGAITPISPRSRRTSIHTPVRLALGGQENEMLHKLRSPRPFSRSTTPSSSIPPPMEAGFNDACGCRPCPGVALSRHHGHP